MSTPHTVTLNYTLTRRQDPSAAATPIVLIGSLGANESMWDRQKQPLSQLADVVAVDVRGHGNSPAPEGPYTMEQLGDDVLALLDRLDVDRAYFVGLSIGGAIVQSIMLQHPHRVAGATLISTATAFGTPAAWADKMETVNTQGTAVLAPTVVKNWFTDNYGQEGAFAHFTAMIGATSDTGYAGCCAALAGFDSQAALRTCTLGNKTQVVSALQDTSTEPETVAKVHHCLSGSTLITIDGAAHLVNWQLPERINEILADHYRSLAA